MADCNLISDKACCTLSLCLPDKAYFADSLSRNCIILAFKIICKSCVLNVVVKFWHTASIFFVYVLLLFS